MNIQDHKTQLEEASSDDSVRNYDRKTEKETVLTGSSHSRSYATIVDQIVDEVPTEGRLFLTLDQGEIDVENNSSDLL